jgi:hypothetical protein
MNPITRCYRPEGLKPREIIRKTMALGMTRIEAKAQYDRLNRLEWWGNEIYSIRVDRDTDLHAMGAEIRMVHISFHRRDQAPATDWRDMQAIKNATVGEDADAISLNPAESRVVDTANEFHLWAPFERDSGKPVRVPIGWQVGLRCEKPYEGSVQRPICE